MRGLTLLCLVGFILTAALYQGGTAPTKTKRSPLSRRPFDSKNGTNSSVFRVNDLAGTIKTPVVQWNGTITAIESHFGFPPESDEDTKWHKARTAPRPGKVNTISEWHPLENPLPFPTTPAPTAAHHNVSVEATVKEDALERP